MKKTAFSILTMIACSTGPLAAQAPTLMLNDKTGWHKISEKSVDLTRERDEISILGANRFAAIKLVASNSDIDVYDLEVYFDQGEQQNFKVRQAIRAGHESPVFEFKNSERILEKIILVYKTKSNPDDQTARMEIWGLKSNTEPTKAVISAPAVMLSDKAGWHKIGERHVDFSSDRDEIPVILADRFSSIRFSVSGASIELLSLEVHYESGDSQKIEVRSPVMQGKESAAFDLHGGERNLKKIVFVYNTIPNQEQSKALVEVWGLKTNVN